MRTNAQYEETKTNTTLSRISNHRLRRRGATMWTVMVSNANAFSNSHISAAITVR